MGRTRLRWRWLACSWSTFPSRRSTDRTRPRRAVGDRRRKSLCHGVDCRRLLAVGCALAARGGGAEGLGLCEVGDCGDDRGCVGVLAYGGGLHGGGCWRVDGFLQFSAEELD